MCRSSPCERGGGRGVNIKDRDPKRFGRSKESQRGRGGEWEERDAGRGRDELVGDNQARVCLLVFIPFCLEGFWSVGGRRWMDEERKTKVESEHRFLSRPGVRWWPPAWGGSCGGDKGMSSSRGEHWLAKKLFHSAGNADRASSVWDGWAGRTQTLSVCFQFCRGLTDER